MTRHIPKAPSEPLRSHVRSTKMNEPWEQARTRRLRIAECFLSLQGEGSRSGLATYFVRTTGCALRCSWCDTPWAFYEGQWRSVETLAEEVISSRARHVCVTGGEPLLQPAVVPLIRHLVDDHELDVVVETSGDQDISCLPRRAVTIMDIKLPGSGMHDRNLWDNVNHLTSRDEVKFVIADRVDYEVARDTTRSRLAGFDGEILFSAVHNSLESGQLAEWILEDGLAVRMQTQLHKQLWPGRDRGV